MSYPFPFFASAALQAGGIQILVMPSWEREGRRVVRRDQWDLGVVLEGGVYHSKDWKIVSFCLGSGSEGGERRVRGLGQEEGGRRWRRGRMLVLWPEEGS